MVVGGGWLERLVVLPERRWRLVLVGSNTSSNAKLVLASLFPFSLPFYPQTESPSGRHWVQLHSVNPVTFAGTESAAREESEMVPDRYRFIPGVNFRFV